MKKILSISYAMPPLLYPRSIQISRILSHLNSFGWKSTVISVDPSSVSKKVARDEGLQKLYNNKLEIVRVPSFENYFFYRLILKLIPFSRKLPDPYIIWAMKAKKAALKLLHSKDFDVLITWGQPMSDHIAGLQIKKKKDIKWIVHFSDPWIDNPYLELGPVSFKINQYMEKQVILNADLVIFTSDTTYNTVLKRYPDNIKRKALVIPHSFDPELFSVLQSVDRNKKLKISHIGNFYGLRDVDEVLSALMRLRERAPDMFSKFLLVMTGNISSEIKEKAARLSLDNVVLFKPPVTYFESLKAMINSDVLLIIESMYDRGLFLPSKLIDYLGSGKPILGIVSPDSISARIIGDASGIVADVNDIESIYNSIVELILAKKENRLEKYCSCDTVKKRFEVQKIATLWDNAVSVD